MMWHILLFLLAISSNLLCSAPRFHPKFVMLTHAFIRKDVSNADEAHNVARIAYDYAPEEPLEYCTKNYHASVRNHSTIGICTFDGTLQQLIHIPTSTHGHHVKAAWSSYDETYITVICAETFREPTTKFANYRLLANTFSLQTKKWGEQILEGSCKPVIYAIQKMGYNNRDELTCEYTKRIPDGRYLLDKSTVDPTSQLPFNPRRKKAEFCYLLHKRTWHNPLLYPNDNIVLKKSQRTWRNKPILQSPAPVSEQDRNDRSFPINS